MKPTKYLLIIIVIMHFTVLANVTIFGGSWDGIVIAMNTFLFILAFALVLPLKKQD